MKILLGLAMAGAIATPGLAAPVPGPGRDGSIILIEGGCGPAAHRDYYGYCRPYGPPAGYYAPGYTRWVCPPGWHFGGGRCWPNG